MLMTAILKDNGLFIPNIDKNFWQNQADNDGLLQLDISPAQENSSAKAKKNFPCRDFIEISQP